MGEEGGQADTWERRALGTFLDPCPFSQFPLHTQLFLQAGEGAGQGCSGGETGEEEMGGSLTGCRGPMGKV